VACYSDKAQAASQLSPCQLGLADQRDWKCCLATLLVEILSLLLFWELPNSLTMCSILFCSNKLYWI
jgi:hypothetical protein